MILFIFFFVLFYKDLVHTMYRVQTLMVFVILIFIILS